jgi:RHS repeat-associated protein
MATKRRVFKVAFLTTVVLLCLSISPIDSALAAGGGSNKICSFLGDDPKPSILDQDIFEFNGAKGEKVTVTLEVDSSGSHTGKRANLSLMDWVTKTWFFRTTTGVLPRTITATLPATGKYLVLVAELPGLPKLESFSGNYCLTLASSAGGYATFAPTPWVEPTGNSAPVANAGPDQTVFVTQTVTLDGSKSSDVDGDPLTYSWSFTSVPSGSAAILSDPSAVKPTFVVDKPGIYLVQLIVNDGYVDSLPDSVTISTENSKPVANAGADQTVYVTDTVQLDGSKSTDVDGDLLSYKWSFVSVPTGSSASLSDTTSVKPSFVADKPGAYVAQLIVNDGKVDSIADTVTITTANSKPVADPGADQTVYVCDTVTLDGSKSTDVDGDPLTFWWSFTSTPSGSVAMLSDPMATNPTFVVDLPGIYVVQLIVNDGTIDSAPKTVTITTANSKPVAEAGPDQIVFVGDKVQLDGSASSDADRDPLSFFWSIISKPDQSTSVLDSSSTFNPTFVPDLSGFYVAQLIVNDGTVDSDPDTTTITANLRMVNVPNVINMTQAAAQAAIVGAKLTVGTITQANSATVPAGSVISQSPVAGTSVAEGSAVSLVVSIGPAMVAVPNVAGMTQAEATSTITSAKLAVGTITQANSATVPAGCVISQNPPAGNSVPEGSLVSLVISLGPVMVTVPSVVGMTQDAAQSAIIEAQLTVGTITSEYHDTIPPGSVISQNPPGGSSAPLGSSVNLVVSRGPSYIPPDPVTVAPPLDPTVVTSLSDATSFLYSGSNPIQTGVAPGTIDSKRAAVLRGKVLDRDNNPLYGVVISILDHPEYGQTFSRLDGMFDLAVNGGGLLTVNYNLLGYMNAQRQVQVPWEDYARLPDTVLIKVDPLVTKINLTEPNQVARGSVVTDGNGTRQSTLLFSQGTTGQMVLPDGSTQDLSSFSVRATEYSVGPNGPHAMPAELPSGMGYTYCVEFTVDEALTSGATNVLFNQPVYHYVENFINFPVGGIVPVGYYDRQKGQWIASQNGRVIKILGITNGYADLDIDGDGTADNSDTLASLGITEVERTQLASLYAPGTSLWRVPIPHFTIYDYNWQYGPPPNATYPPPPPPQKSKPDCPDKNCGSIIENQSQILGEAVSITGTPFFLHYQSDQVPGRKESFTRQIKLSGDTLPVSLKKIRLVTDIAGHHTDQLFLPSPNVIYPFEWDGTNGYGQRVYGDQPLYVSVGYVYQGVYQQPAQLQQTFGQYPGPPITFVNSLQEITLWTTWKDTLNFPDARVQGTFGGWFINALHRYDPGSQTLYLGDGGRRHLNAILLNNGAIYTGAGGGSFFCSEDIPATLATFLTIPSVAPDDQGNTYLVGGSECDFLFKIGQDGIIRNFLKLSPYTNGEQVNDITFDNKESLYFTDFNRVSRVNLKTKTITTVAGGDSAGFSGDSGPATNASLFLPKGVAVGKDGSIYIADTYNHRIRRVTPDGMINTVAGNGNAGDGGPAIAASLNFPNGVAVASDGSIYISDSNNHRIRRISPEGIINTIAGNGIAAFSGDGGSATAASLNSPNGVAVAKDGSVYISDKGNFRIRRVAPDGMIKTIAGNGNGPEINEGAPATSTGIYPRSLKIGPDDNLYFAVNEVGDIWYPGAYSSRFRKVAPIVPQFRYNYVIPSEDGSEIYVFDLGGRHLSTRDGLTGATSYVFNYDSYSGLVTSISDGDGNTTTIPRYTSGGPIAIVGPYGQATTFTYDPNGYLASITNPAGEACQFTYSNDGLLLQTIDPRGNASTYEYDSGRLVLDTNAAGGYRELSRTELPNGYEVSDKTAMGRVTRYRVESVPDGSQRLLNTFPNGLLTEVIKKIDGTEETHYLDGTVVSKTIGPDPRFGLQVPIAKSNIIRTPSGLTSVTIKERTVTLTDPNNPLSLVSLTDTSQINGNTYTSTFDASLGKLTFRTPEGRETVGILDSHGRLVQIERTGLAPLSYTYDGRGRIVTITKGMGVNARITIRGYNIFPTDDGLLDRITDPELSTLNFTEYDEAGRLRTVELPDGNFIRLNYNANGKIIDLQPPGRPPHAFSYTETNAIRSYMPPHPPGDLSYYSNYQYNLDGQLTHEYLPGGVHIENVYGVTNGQIESNTIYYDGIQGGGTDYSYYTAPQALVGKVAALITPYETLEFTYDGPLTTGMSWSGAVLGSVKFTYDNNFRVVSEIINDMFTIPFQYDGDGLLTQAGALTITRDDPARPETKNGLIRGTTLGNVSTALDYNEFGEIKDFTATFNGSSGPVNIVETHYPVRDKLGRIQEKVETVSGVTNIYNYEYDQVGRLWKVSENGILVRQYEYDPNGNRIIRKADGSLDVEYDDQDRLLRYGSTNYAYSKNGTLISKTDPIGQTTYSYSFGHITNVGLPDGTMIGYVHDGKGRRIRKLVNGSPIKSFFYHNDLKPVAEWDHLGQTISLFIYGTSFNVPDFMSKGGVRYRIISDHLGSPRIVINANDGTIVQQMDYDEFGNVILDTNPGFQPFGFAGGIYDPHTKLVRFGARDYDASVGRWTAKDPILFLGNDTNLYAYVGNSPFSQSDPYGLNWKEGLKEVFEVFKKALEVAMTYFTKDPVSSATDIGGAACGLAEVSVELAKTTPKLQEEGELLDELWGTRRTSMIKELSELNAR